MFILLFLRCIPITNGYPIDSIDVFIYVYFFYREYIYVKFGRKNVRLMLSLVHLTSACDVSMLLLDLRPIYNASNFSVEKPHLIS